MFKNYFIVAFRNFRRRKVFSFINVFGLAISLTCFIFITLWVNDELSYDKFNKKSGRIVRVAAKVATATEIFDQAVTSAPLAKAFRDDYAEVENTVRFDKEDAIVQLADKQFAEKGILLTDPSFFDVFDYHLTQGNSKTALNEPFSIVLTQSMAKKYFSSSEGAIGKILTLSLYNYTSTRIDFRVTGVMPDAVKNAHVTFNFLASFKTLEAAIPELLTDAGWSKNSYYTYLLLKDRSDIGKLEAKLPDFSKRHLDKGMNFEGMNYEYWLQPLLSIHLHSRLRYEIEPTGSMQNVYIFSCVAFFILLIAGINYVNLSTAKGMQRVNEIGVKKIFGATKWQLVLQHLTEAVLIAMMSLLSAYFLASLIQPAFKQLSGKDLPLFQSTGLTIFLIVATFVFGLLSGLYPAFLISAFKPVNILKGIFQLNFGGIWLRKSLLVLQFTISVVLMVGIGIINSQLSFIQHKDLGYKKDALLTLQVNNNADIIKNFAAFKNAVSYNPSVRGVTASNSILVGTPANRPATTVTRNGQEVTSNIYNMWADEDYMDVYGMKIIAGRIFYSNINMDSSMPYILNEAAVKAFDWGTAGNAINKPFSMGGRNGKVIGIVKDFHFNSLQHPIEPLVILPCVRGNRFSEITMKIDMHHPKEAISWITENGKKYFPGAILQYDFLDVKLNEQYQVDERFENFFFYFSCLSLLIASLGVFGLTAFTTQQRVREIGIRKVLGAGVGSIVIMLSKDFAKLVFIAALVAFPLAWWAMNKWLQDFAYRVNINGWVFVLAGIVALFIAILTVSFEAIKAAIANPVKSLRTE